VFLHHVEKTRTVQANALWLKKGVVFLISRTTLKGLSTETTKQTIVQFKVSNEDEGCTSLRISGTYLLYYAVPYSSRT
jgi:hypothetical protein